MAHTAESELLADNGDGCIRCAQLLFGLGDDFSSDKVLGGAAQFLAHEIAEVIGREA